MRTKDEFLDRIRGYGLHYVYDEQVGNLAWMYGTGDNVEVLFLQSARPGGGKEIYRMAVREMEKTTPPYYSVYAFTRTDNEAAIRFYTKLGWKRCDLEHTVYGGAETTLFTISFAELKKNLGPS